MGVHFGRRPSLGVTLRTTLVATLFIPACGHVDVWSRDDNGGLLQSRGNADRARQDADRAMTEHCGTGRYQVVPLRAGDLSHGEATGVELRVGPGGPSVNAKSAEEAKRASFTRYQCSTPTPPPPKSQP